jgi:hypothetical protein
MRPWARNERHCQVTEVVPPAQDRAVSGYPSHVYWGWVNSFFPVLEMGSTDGVS